MSSSVPDSLGSRIAGCRDRLGWTQKRLADEARLSVTFVSEVENDRRVPGGEALLRIADALGASLDYLLKGTVDPPPARRPLVIPPELLEAAELLGWSVGDARDLLKFREMVVARRSRAGESDDPERRLSTAEWRELYDWYRKTPL
jgi:transcriptional regulator with XRE-family HTH domain